MSRDPFIPDPKDTKATVFPPAEAERIVSARPVTDDTPRDPLAAQLAVALVRIRGAHNNADYETEEGEPCAWCRLAGEQAAEAFRALDATRPSGDEALTEERIEAAIQSAYDHHDDHRKRHPGHTGECQDDWPAAHRLAPLVRAALATPSSTPDVEGLRHAVEDFLIWWDMPPFVTDDDKLRVEVDALRAAYAAARENKP